MLIRDFIVFFAKETHASFTAVIAVLHNAHVFYFNKLDYCTPIEASQINSISYLALDTTKELQDIIIL